MKCYDACGSGRGNLREIFFRARSGGIFLFVWIVSGVYAWQHLMRGWVPHDEGALTQSAARVLAGELPHRDFTEIYTGGLSLLHALAFRTAGANFGALRMVLFLFFLSWIPAVYFLAREISGPWTAGGVTLLAAAWSIPNYSASMPSWYNLFFATFGAAFLFAHLRSGRKRWLLLAGACGGLSFLAKSTGLYFIAAALLFLVYREQSISLRARDVLGQGKTYSAVLVAAFCGAVAMLFLLVRAQWGGPEFAHFVLPGTVLSALVLLRESKQRRAAWKRWQELCRMLIPFCAGAALPVVIFLIPYARSGALSAFFQGVFVLPSRRILGASMRPEPLYTFLPAVGLCAVAGIAFLLHGRARIVFAVAAALCGALLLKASFANQTAYLTVWHSFHQFIPLLTVAGVWRLHRLSQCGNDLSPGREDRVMLLLCAAALCSLIQFPFAGYIYLCYVAPLGVLAATGLLSTWEKPPRVAVAAIGLYALAAPVLLFTPPFLFEMGSQYTPDEQTTRLALPQASGLRVSEETAKLYGELIPFLREHAAGGELLAGPDCPEVYFLAGKKNPTRTLFEFFEEPAGFEDRIRKLLRDRPIKAAAIQLEPSFSEFYVEPLRRAAAAQFPNSKRIGSFEVYWRP